MNKEKTLGDRIKEMREKLHLSQTELAEAAGVTPSTVSRLESGAVKQLKSDALGHLAQALGLPVEVLLGKETPLHETLVALKKTKGPGPDDVFHTNDPILNRILTGYLKLDKSSRRQVMEYVVFLLELKKKQR